MENIYLKIESPFLTGNKGQPACVVVDIDEWVKQTSDVWKQIAEQLNFIHNTNICEPETLKKQFFDGTITMNAEEIEIDKPEVKAPNKEYEGPTSKYEEPEVLPIDKTVGVRFDNADNMPHYPALDEHDPHLNNQNIQTNIPKTPEEIRAAREEEAYQAWLKTPRGDLGGWPGGK